MEFYSCATDRLAVPTRSTHTLHLTLAFYRIRDKQMLPNQTLIGSVLSHPLLAIRFILPLGGLAVVWERAMFVIKLLLPKFNTSIIRKINQSVKNYFSTGYGIPTLSLPDNQSAFSLRKSLYSAGVSFSSSAIT